MCQIISCDSLSFTPFTTGDAPSFDGVKVKERFARAVSDYIDGSGTATGYAVNILENGDKVFERLAILAQTAVAADGSRKLGYRAVTTLNGGTGRFTGIRGTLLGGGGSNLKTGVSDNGLRVSIGSRSRGSLGLSLRELANALKAPGLC